jgi:ferredoxin-thioredoxin reductase catalytic subunit
MIWYEKIAEKYGMKVNNSMAEVILDGLEHNKIIYGARYCPCKTQKSIENVCPCKEMRETKHCHCGLFD